jgi:hypothetical protein
MRILISYEEAYRVYADALERALGGLRPEAEVAVCRFAEIDHQPVEIVGVTSGEQESGLEGTKSGVSGSRSGTEASTNGFFNSGPWPSSGHPKP